MNIYPEDSYLMAPLSDYTDLPFRNSVRRYGAKYVFIQMIDCGALVWARRQNKEITERNKKTIRRGKDEEWLGVQLLGSIPEILGEAVEILNENEFEVLDFNMGCPMKKVTSRGCGGAMCEDPDLALWCLDTIIKKSKFPVTAKTRIVFNDDIDANVKWAKQLESTGIETLTIHGRERSLIYAGEPDFESLKAISEALNIPVIANGGIMNAKSALEMKEKTNISSGMIARGALGNPWVFRELQPEFMAKVNQLRQAGEKVPKFAPSPELIYQELVTNFTDMVAFHGEESACRVSRKLIIGFLKGKGYDSTFRDQVGRLDTAKGYFDLFDALHLQGPCDDYLNSVTFYDNFLNG